MAEGAPATKAKPAARRTRAKAVQGKESKWIAFFDVQGPLEETYHATIREGATVKDVDEMFELLSHAGLAGTSQGFTFVSEYNEFGQRVTLTRLDALRDAREKATQAKKEAVAQRQANRPARPAQPPATKPAQPSATKPATKPAQTATRSSGRSATRVDLTKSPYEIGRIKIQGTTEDPRLELYSTSKALKHAVLHAPTSVAVAVILQHYEVDGDAVYHWLSDIGADLSLKEPWTVHWETSTKNDKWKDLTDIVIPAKADARIPDDGGPPTDRTTPQADALDEKDILWGDEDIPF